MEARAYSHRQGVDIYHTKATRGPHSCIQGERIRRARKIPQIPAFQQKVEGGGIHDTQTGVPLGIPRGASCVQRFDDSLNSAIHITYRISLRSSSMREPRDPLLKVVFMRVNAKYILRLSKGYVIKTRTFRATHRQPVLVHAKVHKGVDGKSEKGRVRATPRRFL